MAFSAIPTSTNELCDELLEYILDIKGFYSSMTISLLINTRHPENITISVLVGHRYVCTSFCLWNNFPLIHPSIRLLTVFSKAQKSKPMFNFPGTCKLGVRCQEQPFLSNKLFSNILEAFGFMVSDVFIWVVEGLSQWAFFLFSGGVREIKDPQNLMHLHCTVLH